MNGVLQDEQYLQRRLHIVVLNEEVGNPRADKAFHATNLMKGEIC